jgi:hypothetical protein
MENNTINQMKNSIVESHSQLIESRTRQKCDLSSTKLELIHPKGGHLVGSVMQLEGPGD